MARLDVRDKDPFAHVEDEPKDNISTGGFIFRIVIRYLPKYRTLGITPDS